MHQIRAVPQGPKGATALSRVWAWARVSIVQERGWVGGELCWICWLGLVVADQGLLLPLTGLVQRYASYCCREVARQPFCLLAVDGVAMLAGWSNGSVAADWGGVVQRLCWC